MKCEECLYYWLDEDDKLWTDYPRCHWIAKAPDDFPPCEDPYPDEVIDD